MSKSNYALRDRNTGKYVAIKNCTQESNLCYHNVTWSADPVTFVRGTYEYAQRMVDIWCPARAFVIDIALTDDKDDDCNKVIEINCINSSWFYQIDMQKFVMAIEDMEF